MKINKTTKKEQWLIKNGFVIIKNVKFFIFLFITISILPHSFAQANRKKFKINQDIAEWFDRQAESIDLSLSGKKYTNKKEDSSATISQEAFWDDDTGFEYKLDFDLDLALPNFQEKYKLLVSNYNRNKIRRSNYSRRSFREDDENDYGATLEFVRKIGDFDVSFEPRIEIADPIATFYTIRLESEVKKDDYIFDTRFEFFADSEKGTGQFVALTYRNFFYQKWMNIFIFEEEYQDARNILSTLFGYTLHYTLNNRMTIDQSFIFDSSNETRLEDDERIKTTFKLQEVIVGPSFTHRLYKNEIHYSINYNQIFSRRFDFKGRSSASIIIRLIF